jgi:hypothetical protein
MTALLLILCGVAAGWYARKAYATWRAERAVGLVLNGLDPSIIRRAP